MESSVAQVEAEGIHIVDPDYRRRARVAREFHSKAVHAEIYENLEEFCTHAPRKGFLFVADDPDENTGLDNVFDTLGATGLSLPVVVYASRPNPDRIVSAMLAGALDYLEWPFDPSLLDGAFRRLTSDGMRQAEQARLRSQAMASVKALSPREREVLALLAEGLSNIDMGEVLGISSRTVEIHRANMMRKLNAGSTAAAVRIAIYAGLGEGKRTAG